MEDKRARDLAVVQSQVIACRRCPRLVAWREGVAQNPPLRYRGQEYWAKPLPGWGDAVAQLFIVGLAPAAHGGNRTGRVFTGDRSGDWLFRALWKAGFANQPLSVGVDDGLQLNNCYIAATARCAPPQNKLLPEEIANCRPYLQRELELMPQTKVILGLGKIGFDAAFDVMRALGRTTWKARPKFSHGAEAQISENVWLLGTYHPSQQNTFTGKLTETMFDTVFARAHEIINSA
ncbi:MAG: uracil-DNA glycosylase [Abditibacteriota bacterium]|nr:uracil-DNA glycosylase [Abditibacteriota bacterium]